MSEYFYAKPDHPSWIWALFLRKTPKAKPEMIYVTSGGALQMLIAQKELARQLKVPLRRIEPVFYKPSATKEPPAAAQG